MIRFRSLFAVVASAVLVVSACGSSSKKAQPPATTATTQPAESPQQATQEITTTWEAFFGSTGTISQLQDGSQLNALYVKNKTSPLAAGSSANVKSVQLLDAAGCQSPGIPSPCALVTYDILLKGKVVLPGSKGYATEIGGKWLVSKTTFCALLALQNGSVPPAGC
jgi:hypothetical protein